MSATIEDNLRVLQKIEQRAQELQVQLLRLENRWQKRRESLEKQTGELIGYDFCDVLC